MKRAQITLALVVALLVIAPFVVAIVVFGLWPDPVRDLLTTVAPASADGFAGLGR